MLAPAPCGYFYLVFVAFTRGGESKLAVARYQDLNNDEGGDTIEYLGTTVIEVGNNADNGHFLDKPDIEVDVWRGDGGPASECGHRVYVSYSTFVGLDKYGKFQSKLNFAKSEDFGLTYSTVKINKTWNQNQGSTIAIDPGVGTPGQRRRPRHDLRRLAALLRPRRHHRQEVGRLRRQLGQPGGGQRPADGAVRPADHFDRLWKRTISPSARTVFRPPQSPMMARCSSHGRSEPDRRGRPRIVLTRSDNDGATWSSADGGRRGAGRKPYNAGVGGDWQETFRGPQVMPKLSFGGGRLMLAYYESRGLDR